MTSQWEPVYIALYCLRTKTVKLGNAIAANYLQGTMPQRCVAGGCNRRSSDGVTLHKFPRDTSLSNKWSRAIKVHCADWTSPSSNSALCSLHFKRECYDSETVLRQQMGLSDKRRTLKPDAVPTLFPTAKQVDSGMMAWCEGSIHSASKRPDDSTSITSRHTFLKRQRSQVTSIAQKAVTKQLC